MTCAFDLQISFLGFSWVFFANLTHFAFAKAGTARAIFLRWCTEEGASAYAKVCKPKKSLTRHHKSMYPARGGGWCAKWNVKGMEAQVWERGIKMRGKPERVSVRVLSRSHQGPGLWFGLAGSAVLRDDEGAVRWKASRRLANFTRNVFCLKTG